jgi:serine phosphatase RsbU (regulator of sigma subunit)
VRDGAAAARTAEVALEPGDLLVLYTDGVTEARDPSGRQFEEEGLLAALEDAPGRRVDAVADGVLQAVSRHEPGPASDDRLVMVVRAR